MGKSPSVLSALEYHVLLALAEAPRYGYAIQKAVVEESGGSVSPKAGSLYRVIARLMGWGFAEEVDRAQAPERTHPGLERKYYRLTKAGRLAVKTEAARLRSAANLADRRFGLGG